MLSVVEAIRNYEAIKLLHSQGKDISVNTFEGQLWHNENPLSRLVDPEIIYSLLDLKKASEWEFIPQRIYQQYPDLNGAYYKEKIPFDYKDQSLPDEFYAPGLYTKFQMDFINGFAQELGLTDKEDVSNSYKKEFLRQAYEIAPFPEHLLIIESYNQNIQVSILPQILFGFHNALNLFSPRTNPLEWSHYSYSTQNIELPSTQWIGRDPNSGVLRFYKKDAKDRWYGVYSPRFGIWFDGSTLPEFSVYPLNQIPNLERPSFRVPQSVKEALSVEDRIDIYDTLANSGKFKSRTQYVIIGDEPSPRSCGVVNIKAQMSEDQEAQLKALFTQMPRMYLRGWFEENVAPSLSGPKMDEYLNSFKQSQTMGSYAPIAVGETRDIAAIYGASYLRPKRDYEDMMWAAFIDFFNEANLIYCNENQLDPWTWEDEKLKAYYISINEDDFKALEEKFKSYVELNVPTDPKAEALMFEYNSLPRLGDEGLEITRQNAIFQLLAQKDYETVKGVIDAYRYASYTVLGEALTKPIPFDIVSNDGKIVKATGI